MSRLPRYTALKRGGPIRPKKRSAKEKARIYGSDERIAWVKAQPCVVLGCPRRPCENAHTANAGMSRKAGAATIVPLCPYHHAELHNHGVRTFETLHRLDLAACAERTERAWVASQEAA